MARLPIDSHPNHFETGWLYEPTWLKGIYEMEKKRTAINALKAAKLIRSGVDDKELMERFNISAKGLQSLFKKLVESGLLTAYDLEGRASLSRETVILEADQADFGNAKAKSKHIESSEALYCIRLGMDDFELMEKFRISARGLQDLFEKLVAKGMMTPAELYERASVLGDSVVLEADWSSLAVSPKRPPEITASDALACIRSGMDDAELMKRYNISAKGLRSLVDKLVEAGLLESQDFENRDTGEYESVIMNVQPPRFPVSKEKKPSIRIYSSEALKYIKSGMDDAELMKRYSLSARGLESLFRKLFAAGKITQDELDQRVSDDDDSVRVDTDTLRFAPSGTLSGEIDTHELLSCIEQGMNRSEVMEKYQTSTQELQTMLDMLVSQGLITQPHLDLQMPRVGETLQIMHRSADEVVFSAEASSVRMLVEKAYSTGVDLSGADLRGVNLARADLAGIQLRGADLTGAVLVGTDLSKANLTETSLASAQMYGASLQNANLSESDLADCNMTMVYAIGANFYGANLSEANLTNANLEGANLDRCILFQTILKGTVLG